MQNSTQEDSMFRVFEISAKANSNPAARLIQKKRKRLLEHLQRSIESPSSPNPSSNIAERLIREKRKWRLENPLFKRILWASKDVLDKNFDCLTQLVASKVSEHMEGYKELHVLANMLDMHETNGLESRSDTTAVKLFTTLELIPGEFTELSNDDGNYLASVIFGYKLFDQYLRHCQGGNGSEAVLPRIRMPQFADKFKTRIMDKLNDWPRVLEGAFQLHLQNENAKEIEPFSTPIQIAPAQIEFRRVLKGMERVAKRASTHRVEKILLNIESAVAAIRWIFQGNMDVPPDVERMHTSLIQSAERANLDLKKEWLQENVNFSPASLRNPLQFALAITPLVLLLPSDLTSTTIRRDSLIKLSKSLGNQKPKALLVVEDLMWRMIFNVVLGVPMEDEVAAFMREYNNMFDSINNASDVQRSWFSETYIDIQTSPSISGPSESPRLYGNSQISSGPADSISGEESIRRDSSKESGLASSDGVKQGHQGSPTFDPSAGPSSFDDAPPSEDHLEIEGASSNRSQAPTIGPTNLARKRKRVPQNELGCSDNQSEHISDSNQSEEDVQGRVVSESSGLPLPPTRILRRRRTSYLTRAGKAVSSKNSRPLHSQKGINQHREVRELTEVIDLIEEPMPPSNLNKVKRQKRINSGVTLKVYGMDPKDHPLEYMLKAYEHRHLDAVQDLINNATDFYVDGRPRHHQVSARNNNFDPLDAMQSCAFICSFQDFNNLAPYEVRSVLKDRHIIITDVPDDQSRMVFSKSGLREIGSLKESRHVHVQSLKTKEDETNCLRFGTFEEILKEAELGDEGEIINSLDNQLSRPDCLPPHHRSISTDSIAWSEARHRKGLVRREYPIAESMRSTITLRDSYISPHIDGDGPVSAIIPAAGVQIWAIASSIPSMCARNDSRSAGKNIGNMRSIHAFSREYDPFSQPSDRFKWELFVLKSKTILIMKPNTPHAMVTAENSIFLGRYLFCSTTMLDTCCCMLHCFATGGIRAAYNEDASRCSLRRIAAMWLKYFQTQYEDVEELEHTPNVTDSCQLLEVLAVFNTIELSEVIDVRYYTKTIPPSEQLEMDEGHQMYKDFKEWFCENHILRNSQDKEVDADVYLFNYSLARFAACIVKYKELQGLDQKNRLRRKQRNISAEGPQVSLEETMRAIENHLEKPVWTIYNSLLMDGTLHMPFEFYESFSVERRMGDGSDESVITSQCD